MITKKDLRAAIRTHLERSHRAAQALGECAEGEDTFALRKVLDRLLRRIPAKTIREASVDLELVRHYSDGRLYGAED